MGGQRNKGKIFQYSLESLARAVEAVRNGGMSVLRASLTFKIPRTTLRQKLNGATPLDVRKVGPECKLGKEVENKLVEWILGMASRGFPVNKDGLLCSVKKLIEQANVGDDFINGVPGKKWFSLFLKRHPIISQKHAEFVTKARAMVTEENVRGWFEETAELLGNDIDVLRFADRVWNMDETAMFLSPKGSLVLAERGKSCYDVISTSEKENVTTLITANAAGELAPPLTIFKYDRLPAIIPKSAPAGWGIGKSDTGWMQSDTFFEYFTNVFVPYLETKKATFPIIVFIDGHKSHLSLHLSKFCRERQIILISLYPNTTHIMQPLDIAFFFPLKQAWKKIGKKWSLEHDGQSIQKKDIPALLNEIITENDFTNSLISGFKRSGLCPFDANAVDYSKCLNKSSKQPPAIRELTVGLNEDKQVVILQHLNFIESRIDEEILRQFNQTFRENTEFSGDRSYLELYRFWYKIKGSLDDYPKNEIISELTDKSSIENDSLILDNTLEFPFPEYDWLENYAEENNAIMQEARDGNEDDQSTASEQIVLEIKNKDNKEGVNGTITTAREEKIENENEYEDSTALEEAVLKIKNKDNTEGVNRIITMAREEKNTENEKEHEQFVVSGDTVEVVQKKVTANHEKKIRVLQDIVVKLVEPIKPPKRSAEEILESVLVWPELTSANKKSKNKKKREHLPSVLTSDKWLAIVEAKDEEKKRLEEEKAQRKIKREEAKTKKNATKEKKETKSVTKPNEKKIEPKFVANGFVILKYDDHYYPAKILKVGKDLVFCSAMHRSGMNWKWPEKADTLWYSHDDLIEIISSPSILNTRGIYTVPEIDKYM